MESPLYKEVWAWKLCSCQWQQSASDSKQQMPVTASSQWQKAASDSKQPVTAISQWQQTADASDSKQPVTASSQWQQSASDSNQPVTAISQWQRSASDSNQSVIAISQWQQAAAASDSKQLTPPLNRLACFRERGILGSRRIQGEDRVNPQCTGWEPHGPPGLHFFKETYKTQSPVF